MERQTLTEPCYVSNDEIETGYRASLRMSSNGCTELSEMKFSENDKAVKASTKKENGSGEWVEVIDNINPTVLRLSMDKSTLTGIAV